jgi:hypothetical protein
MSPGLPEDNPFIMHKDGQEQDLFPNSLPPADGYGDVGFLIALFTGVLVLLVLIELTQIRGVADARVIKLINENIPISTFPTS